MKYPYKPTITNLIFTTIVIIIIAVINVRIYGVESFTFGMIIGTIFITLLVSFLLAILVWFMRGKKHKGGSITFNVVLVIFFLGSLSEFGNIIEDRQEPIEEIKSALTEYKKSTKENQSTDDEDVNKLSNNIQGSLDKLIKTSVGNERKLYIIVQEYYRKMDSINSKWNSAHAEFMSPEILDFHSIESEKNYNYQIDVINRYIEQSKVYKAFFKNRSNYLNKRIKILDTDSKAILGFKRGFAKKDSIQQPIFQEYINGHISYGQNLKDIIELLRRNDGDWKMVDEEIVIQDPKNQEKYDRILYLAIENEEKVNYYSQRLAEVQ